MPVMAGTKQIPADYDVASLRANLAAVEAMIPRTRALLDKASNVHGKQLHGLLGGFERAEKAMLAARKGVEKICDAIDKAAVQSGAKPK